MEDMTMKQTTSKRERENRPSVLALAQQAQRFSSEFWSELFSVSLDLDLIHSIFSSLVKKHQQGEDEEAIDLLYAINLFDGLEMCLPVAEIVELPRGAKVFMTAFLNASEDIIEDVEDEAEEFLEDLEAYLDE